MANRLLIATLYSNGSINFINVTPNNTRLNEGDSVYLIVESGNIAVNGGDTATINISFTGTCPFPSPIAPITGIALGTITSLGTIASTKKKIDADYQITITYNDVTYEEDPKMTVKPGDGDI
ncbi:MAG: hypothetical protein JXR03_13685 [Cyclobacteriaceae bacterium]